MPGFVLLVRDRKDDDPAMRYGLTVSKKVGNAVVRNRMKRRFRSPAALDRRPYQGLAEGPFAHPAAHLPLPAIMFGLCDHRD